MYSAPCNSRNANFERLENLDTTNVAKDDGFEQAEREKAQQEEDMWADRQNKREAQIKRDFKHQVAANIRGDNRESAMAALDTLNRKAKESEAALESPKPIDSSMRTPLVEAGLVVERPFKTDKEAKLYAKSNQLGPVRIVTIAKGQWEVRQQLSTNRTPIDNLIADGPQLPIQIQLKEEEATYDSDPQVEAEFEGLDADTIPDTPKYEDVVADPE